MNNGAQLLTNDKAQMKALAGIANMGRANAISRNRAAEKDKAPGANTQTSGQPSRAYQAVELKAVERKAKRINPTLPLAQPRQALHA